MPTNEKLQLITDAGERKRNRRNEEEAILLSTDKYDELIIAAAALNNAKENASTEGNTRVIPESIEILTESIDNTCKVLAELKSVEDRPT